MIIRAQGYSPKFINARIVILMSGWQQIAFPLFLIFKYYIVSALEKLCFLQVFISAFRKSKQDIFDGIGLK